MRYVTVLVLVLAEVCFAGGWVTHREMVDSGLNWEAQGDRPWQKPFISGGLGFDVSYAQWPRLSQRGYLHDLSGHHGTREVKEMLRHLDLGQIRTPGEGRGRVVSSNWCWQVYGFGFGGRRLDVFVSRLSPALLLVSPTIQLDLFAGEKYIGQRWTDPNSNRPEVVKSKLVPAWVAFADANGVQVKSTTADVDLSGMSENWLLFWYGADSEYLRTAAPNMLWRTNALKKAMRQGDYFVQVDVPVLVTLGRRAKKLERGEDCLQLVLDYMGSPMHTIMPLTGFNHPDVAVTQKWSQGLDEQVIEQCRLWARRLKSYPFMCSQEYRILDDGEKLQIRNRFRYMQRDIAWDMPWQQIAPVPPAVALAKKYGGQGGLGVEISGELAPGAVSTHSGPYTGIADTNEVTVTISGLNKFVKTRQSGSDPNDLKKGPARELIAELNAEVAKMVDAGRLAPAWVLGRKHVSRTEVLFANPRQLLAVVADAAEYLDEPLRTKAIEYALAEIESTDPINISEVPIFEGHRREYFEMVSPEFFDKVTKKNPSIRRMHLIGEDRRLDNIYALWQIAKTSNQWGYLKRIWSNFKKRTYLVDNGSDWASLSHFRVSDAWAGSVQSTNAHFARYVGMARVAQQLQDSESLERAYYMLAKTALRRLAQGKYLEYAYDAGFVNIDLGSDWMVKLSTSYGEAGTAQLWVRQWQGPADDPRSVLFWDEFGPVLGYMDNEWRPKLVRVLNLTPELGAFLRDNLQGEHERFVHLVEKNSPAWFVTDRESYMGKETSVDSPCNAEGLFLAKCYILDCSGEQMLKYQDVPAFAVGDLLHMRKLIANIKQFQTGKYKSH